MNVLPARQLEFFADAEHLSGISLRHGSAIDIGPLDATFRDSARAPLHSWFPYLEGYSPRFVESVLREYLPSATRILEPFAGSGTTPIVLGQAGIACAYAEANPVMAFIVRTKLAVLCLPAAEKRRLSEQLLSLSRQLPLIIQSASPDVSLSQSYIDAFGLSVFFDDHILEDLLKIRTVADDIIHENELLGNCLLLAILSCLIPSSRLKRAGDLRFKTPKELAQGVPSVAKSTCERLVIQANEAPHVPGLQAASEFACANAANLDLSVEGLWDGVITSPPYLNGTNYIRNARLELWFTREVRSKGDLRRLRDGVVTSGINDVDAQTAWTPVSAGVSRVVSELEEKAYDQRIAKMVGGYFHDMRNVMSALASTLCDGARLCIDIGDSIYAGVHVPTDDLLVEVAGNIGLRTLERVHLRKRISKSGQAVRQQLLVFEK